MTTRKKSSEYYLLLTLTVMLSCFGHATAIAQTDWESPLHQNHALVGSIWLVAQERFISRDELLSQLQQHPILLLGEKHDNPDHHRLRLSLLDGLLSPADRTLMALEMMERGQQAQINALAADGLRPDDPALAGRLTWDEEGWPWPFYGPVVRLALERSARLVAGNINSSEVMAIYRDASPTAPQTLAENQLAQLERDIDSSHCGLLPASQFPAMVRVQQARDRQMADALMSDIDAIEQRVLLAGNYHIRHDLGVPNYLPEQLTRPPLSLAFLEVDPELDEPADYLQQFSDIAPYDVVWFTPALRHDDYCADMRAARNP